MLHMPDTWTPRLAGCAIIAVVLTIAVTAGHVSPASGQDPDRQAQVAQFLERLEKTRARLNLTDEQVEQVKPILRAGFEAQKKVLHKHGIEIRPGAEAAGRLSLLELRRLNRDLSKVREQTHDKLSDILTDEQIKVYREIQEERRQELRERLRKRRG